MLCAKASDSWVCAANAPQEKLLGQPLFCPTCLTRLTRLTRLTNPFAGASL